MVTFIAFTWISRAWWVLVGCIFVKISRFLTWTNRVFISVFVFFFVVKNLFIQCNNFFWDFPAPGIFIGVMTVITNFFGIYSAKSVC